MAVMYSANVLAGTAKRMYYNAGAPTDGAAGTFYNRANPGDLLTDTTNSILYINTNTKASPTWTKVGAQV
jgi:hypothetical protein